MATSDTFGMCKQEISLTNQKFFGHLVFFIPTFVLDFLLKVVSDESLGTQVFTFDVSREVTKIPALGVHDKGADERAQLERKDLELYA